ncbi:MULTISPECIES: hypothetical protein [Microbacterium]|uniref:Uncharacterized protein n=1 Tax=Microbacterium hominis TaxID=162426 RepID=A0A2K9DFX1_9MICO|nr:MULTISPECIES: hypothetical protein [Microbacterium]AUG29859.1 hypothetical protein CXR34_10665 [Microbacterium hominis]
MRDLLLEIAGLQDGGVLDGFELSVISRVHQQMTDSIREVYRPRSSLEAQLEHEKARKDLESQGITIPAWTEDDTAFVVERWERWRDR